MSKIKILTYSLFLCFLSTQVFAETLSITSAIEKMTPKDATTIYIAKKIITMDDDKPTATAVAVSGERIVAVGSLDEVKDALKGQDIVIDQRFSGKIIMPGFIDPHLHTFLLAFLAPSVFITPDDWDFPWAEIKGIEGHDAYIKKLTESEKAMKENKEWLITWGYHQAFHGQISRKDLDKISLTRPIVVWHRSFHEIYLNTAAIQAMNITENKIKGQGLATEQIDLPKGHFWESGFILLLTKYLVSYVASPARFTQGLKMCKEYIAASGLTTICDPGIELPDSAMEMIRQEFDNNSAPFRSLCIANGQLIYENYGAAKALEETEKRLSKNGHQVYFLQNEIKLFCDGAAFSQNMQLKEPYTDGHKGAWIQPPEELEACAKLYWDAGYQIRVHVNGDLGNEVLIGILDKLLKENPRSDHRFTFDHFCVSTVDQAQRISSLKGLVSVNPYYVYVLSDKFTESGLGPERGQHMVRCNSLLKNNIPLSLHSDSTMAPAQPLYLAWCAANRLTMSGKVAGPEERISVKEALKAVTINAAFTLHKEKEVGSIKQGKIADFTILEQDPMTVEPTQLKDITIWGNIFEGTVHQIKSKKHVSHYLSKATSTKEDRIFDLAIKDEEPHACACITNQLLQQFARLYPETF